MPGLLKKITRRMRSLTAALPRSRLLSLTKGTGSGLSRQVRPRLLILFSLLPRQSRLSSLTADWVNTQEKPCCMTGGRAEQTPKLFQLCRLRFRHPRQRAGAQRGFLMSSWLDRLRPKLRIMYENIKEKSKVRAVQADRSNLAESALTILIWQCRRDQWKEKRQWEQQGKGLTAGCL